MISYLCLAIPIHPQEVYEEKKERKGLVNLLEMPRVELGYKQSLISLLLTIFSLSESASSHNLL